MATRLTKVEREALAAFLARHDLKRSQVELARIDGKVRVEVGAPHFIGFVPLRV